MAAHRRLDRRRVCLCPVEFRKRAWHVPKKRENLVNGFVIEAGFRFFSKRSFHLRSAGRHEKLSRSRQTSSGFLYRKLFKNARHFSLEISPCEFSRRDARVKIGTQKTRSFSPEHIKWRYFQFPAYLAQELRILRMTFQPDTACA